MTRGLTWRVIFLRRGGLHTSSLEFTMPQKGRTLVARAPKRRATLTRKAVIISSKSTARMRADPSTRKLEPAQSASHLGPDRPGRHLRAGANPLPPRTSNALGPAGRWISSAARGPKFADSPLEGSGFELVVPPSFSSWPDSPRDHLDQRGG
jgi:hypothetical protein